MTPNHSHRHSIHPSTITAPSLHSTTISQHKPLLFPSALLNKWRQSPSLFLLPNRYITPNWACFYFAIFRFKFDRFLQFPRRIDSNWPHGYLNCKIEEKKSAMEWNWWFVMYDLSLTLIIIASKVNLLYLLHQKMKIYYKHEHTQ